MPNADAYQMLAYCTTLSLARDFMIYAKVDVLADEIALTEVLVDVA